MDELTLPAPVLVDVIPAEQADATIHAARQHLADLHHQVEAVTLAADAAERQCLSIGADSTLLGRAAEQVQLFIEQHRSATDVELKQLLDAAADQARTRVDEARAAADRMTADARRLRAQARVGQPVEVDREGAPLPAGDGPTPSELVSDVEADPHADAGTDGSIVDLAAVGGEPIEDRGVEDGVSEDDVSEDDVVEDGAPTEGPGPLLEAPGPAEPLWISERAALLTAPIRTVDVLAEPTATPAPRSGTVESWGAWATGGSLDAPTGTLDAVDAVDAVEPVGPLAAEPRGDVLVEPAPNLAPTPETAAMPESTASDVPARLRLGSVPVFALLQVVALIVVLVVLLAFVG